MVGSESEKQIADRPTRERSPTARPPRRRVHAGRPETRPHWAASSTKARRGLSVWSFNRLWRLLNFGDFLLRCAKQFSKSLCSRGLANFPKSALAQLLPSPVLAAINDELSDRPRRDGPSRKEACKHWGGGIPIRTCIHTLDAFMHRWTVAEGSNRRCTNFPQN